MDIVERKDGLWQVVNLSNQDVLFVGDLCECENYVYAIHMSMTGI